MGAILRLAADHGAFEVLAQQKRADVLKPDFVVDGQLPVNQRADGAMSAGVGVFFFGKRIKVFEAMPEVDTTSVVGTSAMTFDGSRRRRRRVEWPPDTDLSWLEAGLKPCRDV